MIRFLVKRPIAVLITFISFILLGLVLMRRVPTSLLPEVEVPQITIRLEVPNTPATVMESDYLTRIRGVMTGVKGLKGLESTAANHLGWVYLEFEFGSRMDLAYVEVNERVDRLMGQLPRNVKRPVVTRVNVSDIPILRLQIIPKSQISLRETSILAEKSIKRRLEQIPGVGTVDMNGIQRPEIHIIPDLNMISSLGLSEERLYQQIKEQSNQIGGLNIRDGQYRYFLRITTGFDNLETLKSLPIKGGNDQVIQLSRIAKVEEVEEEPVSYHLYNGEIGIVITVEKQADSRMSELVGRLREEVKVFEKEYPQLSFSITQDQSFLLDAGIDNLTQDLYYGGILTILLLFLFLGNWRSPLLMGISIPSSLIITFVFFWVFDISFNIISLSGLALGIGMLIDNSIVVLDNIMRHRTQGMSPFQSSVIGTNEVITPVISQVLTTIAVYAPLLILSGISGQLVKDQAIGLTICLLVSLFVAFVVSPILYLILHKNDSNFARNDTRFFKWISKGYHRMIEHILRFPRAYSIFAILFMPVGIWLGTKLPIQSIPELKQTELLVKINWNKPIDIKTNLSNCKRLSSEMLRYTSSIEADIGVKKFLRESEVTELPTAEIFFTCPSVHQKEEAGNWAKQWLSSNFPDAFFEIMDAPNAFTQLFVSRKPYLEARLVSQERRPTSQEIVRLDTLIHRLPTGSYSKGKAFSQEAMIQATLDLPGLRLYGIRENSLLEALGKAYGSYSLTDIDESGEKKYIKVLVQGGASGQPVSISAEDGTAYDLKQFVSFEKGEQRKYFTADEGSPYWGIRFEEGQISAERWMELVKRNAAGLGYDVDFNGLYYDERTQLKELSLVFLVVVALIYLILSIQYENLWQPFIVMLSIPLGITGGMIVLWLSGSSINVMSAIGFIVILGLIVDDPILKMETLNRLENKYLRSGLVHDKTLLIQMIHEAGQICLKPLLMVSLTTSIALVPVLFIDGLGNELQKPMAYVIIGGLTLGTFFTTWFTPLAYWYISSKFRKNK